MSEKDDDDLAAEFLNHALMNETQDYVSRGRALGDRDDADVQELWLATFERWFNDRTAEHQREMEDAAAELRLRNLEPPYDRAKSTIDRMTAEIAGENPDDPPERLKTSIDEFLKDRSKPKN